MKHAADKALYGTGLLGESLAPDKGGAMAERFLLPPFSVFNAREGEWQDRKRTWLALGIKSELGRGGNLEQRSEISKTKTEIINALNQASPRGAAMPAMNYKQRQGGTGVGHAVQGTEATQKNPGAVVPSTTAHGAAAPYPPTVQPPAIGEPERPAPIAGLVRANTERAGIPIPLSGVASTQPASIFDNEDEQPVFAPLSKLPAIPTVQAAPAAETLAPAAGLGPTAAALSAPGSAPRAAGKYVDEFVREHAAIIKSELPHDFDGESWDWDSKTALGMDVECFTNFFLVCFKRFSDGKRLAFEMSGRTGWELDTDTLLKVITQNRVITFNGAVYDVPMVFSALGGLDCAALKQRSDKIILGGMKHWQVEKEFGLQVPKLDHIDLIETNPSVRQSLKTLAARLHCKHVVDMPFQVHEPLPVGRMNHATMYCMNDIDCTQELFKALAEPLELRRNLSNQYRVDLRSRSDAQIGETIVKTRVQQLTGQQVRRADNYNEISFRYAVPPFIDFKMQQMRDVVALLAAETFRADAGGTVATPGFLKGLTIHIGDMDYSMGIGGLHSTEQHRAVVPGPDELLVDMDVASQYPRIVILLGLYPKAVGPAFLTVYVALIEERLAAKKAGDKVKAEGGKIAVNGVWGKTGSVYSPLYAPDITVGVTLTGQLSMLMLVEQIEDAGMRVVSANTDGVTALLKKEQEPRLQEIVKAWEAATTFEVEQAVYRGLYNASVNTYMAVRADGKVKRKGAIADPWTDKDQRGQLSKNPQMTVCSHAVMQHALHGTKFEDTVRACADPRMFVTAIKVKGGAQWRGAFLGRVVRYYWSTDGEPITYIENGKKVSKTDGAKPMMCLPEKLPPDVDWARYVDEAETIAADLGMLTAGRLVL